MTLTEKLKEATVAQHKALDEIPGLQVITSEKVSIQDYKQYLKAFQVIHRNIEERIYLKGSQYIPGIEYNIRLSQIEQDMNSLVLETTASELGNEFLKLTDHAVIGAIYVMEGSRLGGKYIAAHLRSHLGLNNEVLNYLNGKPEISWNELKTRINNIPEDKHAEVIKGGTEAFTFYYETLNKIFETA
ncbi:MAG: biliverdin-producing heme oxygenase [Brumimicrobium sp.]|nr:biliverdin-producing heme oxygenase [Brumimicrobium sp.]